MKDIFCFIHIEKAGGSTLHNWLKYYLPNYLSLKPYYIWTNEKKSEMTQKELEILSYFHPFMDGFGSHRTRHNLLYDSIFNRNLLYLTFLREPINRYLSHFQHQKYSMGHNRTFEEFLDDTRFNNFMCKKICGVEDAELAFNELKNNYGFVGFIEHFNESILLLTQLLKDKKIKPLYEKINEGRVEKKIRFSELRVDYKIQIEKNNYEDLKFYEASYNFFYEKQLSNYKGNIIEDLLKLEEELKEFKYNKLRKEIIRFYKGYNHYISEPFAHFFK